MVGTTTNLLNLRDLKESTFKNSNQIISIVTTKTWFFGRQNGPELGQIQAWYVNEKMIVLPLCLNGHVVFQNTRTLYSISKDEGNESRLS